MSYLFNKRSLISFLIFVLIANINCFTLKPEYANNNENLNKIQSTSSLNQNDYVFDLADITVNYADKFHDHKLEAFRIKENDKILQQKDSQRYKELKWVSIG